ncbi:MAG: glycosyltransferase family 9 protein [Nitrospiraceae bacterium]|nr:glycosyltransferase family 9 protein [Nitrospiraceae bacterium]
MNWKIIRIIDALIGIPLVLVLSPMARLLRRNRTADDPSSPTRILLVKFWGNGNIFLLQPATMLLRSAYPHASLELLTLTSNGDAAVCTKAYAAVHTVDTAGYGSFLRTTLAMLSQLRRRHYDIIIDFEQFARFSALAVLLIGGGKTVGFRTAGQHRHHLFHEPLSYDNTVHVTRSYCMLANAAGAPGTCGGPQPDADRFAPDGEGDAFLARLGIEDGLPLVILHAGTSANFRERRWPAASFAELADLLLETQELQIVLTGLADEAGIAAEIVARSRKGNRIIDASGRLTFFEYAALIRRSSVVVSGDTAAVHIASWLGVPVVGLYGPNTPILYGPWSKGSLSVYAGLACSPCITNFNAKTTTCRHPEGKGVCMRKIRAADVLRMMREQGMVPATPRARETRSRMAEVRCAD